MRECYFDPAMQAHRQRMQVVYKSQARRAFLRKYAGLLTISALAFAGSAALVLWRVLQ